MAEITESLRFDHLESLTGRHGLYEHARFEQPRRHHGYTTDDNARALVVLARAGEHGRLDRYRDFVLAGRISGGWHNRMSDRGMWTDWAGSDDAMGRAIWGLCHVAESGLTDDVLAHLALFESEHPRAIAYAVLGLTHLLERQSGLEEGERCLERLATTLPRPVSPPWMWPASRLTYDNARIPEALILAGSAIDDAGLVEEGLELLHWLIEEETGPLGFSFTPVGGRGEASPKPGYDQQPIEAWAMADAALAAFRVDGSLDWARAVENAGQWFLGRNDVGVALYDPDTGGGYDGLHSHGVNLNQGAESTLSALGAMLAMNEVSQISYEGSG